ncbi:hypothetical protein [Pantoea sp. LMR881]|uniref:hypothetical protein n=1 Tax=Pantoea sp. LMR881 TaxID=3014336 RepID=UPI002F35ECFA
MKPQTADSSYYLRGQKSDGTAHWYLGQSSNGTDNVTSNNTSNKWLMLGADGTGNSNVTNMNFQVELLLVQPGLEVKGGGPFNASLTLGYRQMFQRANAPGYQSFSRTE